MSDEPKDAKEAKETKETPVPPLPPTAAEIAEMRGLLHRLRQERETDSAKMAALERRLADAEARRAAAKKPSAPILDAILGDDDDGEPE